MLPHVVEREVMLWEGARGSVKKAGLLALVFTITLDTAEWMADYEQRDPATGKPKKDLFDLLFRIGIDVTKAALSTAIGAALIGSLIWVGSAFAVALGGALVVSGGVLIVGTIVAAIIVGGLLDLVDRKTGFTESLNQKIRSGSGYLKSKLPIDYESYDKSMETTLTFGGGA